jgi:hypothetical protein
MNVDKMRSVLAKNASIVRKEREHSAQLRQEKMVQIMGFLNQKRQETQLRREQLSPSTSSTRQAAGHTRSHCRSWW